MQRVTHTADHTSGAVQATTSFSYNALGNVLTKGGIAGTYDYGATPQTSCPSGYTTTPGPHAVRAAGSQNFCYDHNGNQTRGWNFILNRQRTQTWTSFNMPAAITENGTSITFSYGADRQRFRHVNGFTGTTTIYVEGLFDREVTGATGYELGGKQYVAIASGGRAGSTTTLGRLVGVDVPQGSGVLWVFALPDDEPREVPRPTRRDQPRRSLADERVHGRAGRARCTAVRAGMRHLP